MLFNFYCTRRLVFLVAFIPMTGLIACSSNDKRSFASSIAMTDTDYGYY